MNAFDRESDRGRAPSCRSGPFPGRPARSLAKPEHRTKEVEFFSICTNDSIPYTLTVDRPYETATGFSCTAKPSPAPPPRRRERLQAMVQVSTCGATRWVESQLTRTLQIAPCVVVPERHGRFERA